MKKYLTLLGAATLFAACTNDDPQHLQHTFRGKLSNLTRVDDPGSPRPLWHLVVDVEDDPILRGECTWSGHLGDSAMVYETEISPNLYTNTSMGGTKKASAFRVEGINLSMDSVAMSSYLTHYRADFDCEY